MTAAMSNEPNPAVKPRRGAKPPRRRRRSARCLGRQSRDRQPDSAVYAESAREAAQRIQSLVDRMQDSPKKEQGKLASTLLTLVKRFGRR